MRFLKDRAWFWATFSLVFVAPIPAMAGDGDATENLRDRLLAARETFSELQQMQIVYDEKKAIVDQLMDCEQAHSEQLAYVSNLGIQLNGYPRLGRMNSLQKEVHQEWLIARQSLNEIATNIRALKGQIRRIDEAVLEQAANQGTRPGPNQRRDILKMYPGKREECKQRFEELRAAAKAVSPTSQTTEFETIREANVALNSEGEGDDRFGPSAPFFSAMRRFLSGKFTVEKRSAGKGKKQKQRK